MVCDDNIILLLISIPVRQCVAIGKDTLRLCEDLPASFVNTSKVVNCSLGYHLPGKRTSQTVTCMANGRWKVTICNRKLTQKPL